MEIVNRVFEVQTPTFKCYECNFLMEVVNKANGINKIYYQ